MFFQSDTVRIAQFYTFLPIALNKYALCYIAFKAEDPATKSKTMSREIEKIKVERKCYEDVSSVFSKGSERQPRLSSIQGRDNIERPLTAIIVSR